MLLAYEPFGELALPSPTGVRLLGLHVTSASWPTLRHVFELDADAGLHVEVDGLGHVNAFAVGYTFDCDELLTPL